MSVFIRRGSDRLVVRCSLYAGEGEPFIFNIDHSIKSVAHMQGAWATR